MLYPLTFHPLLQERVWGGRRIGCLYQKRLPTNAPFGESWEISDRPGNISIIANGPLAGTDLHTLVEQQPRDLFGDDFAVPPRFPWLIKILDAQDKLSLQVHPPAAVAAELGGEPKSELWYVAAAEPGADIFVGLKQGVTREEFERRIADGTVAECFHRVEVNPGDSMFLHSGRVHALGAGCVVFEVQENSDTTYRVFDWNRMGLDGKPRDLHLDKSLRSIDFQDFEPALIQNPFRSTDYGSCRPLVNNPLFCVDLLQISSGRTVKLNPHRLQVVGITAGSVSLNWQESSMKLDVGGFALVPACLNNVVLQATTDTELLLVQPEIPDE